MYCRNCGESVDENAIICVKCGAAKNEGTEYCAHCGSKVEKGQIACTSCGYALPKEKFNIKKFIKKRKKTIIISSIVLGVIIIGIITISIIMNANKKVNFQELYDEYCTPMWALIGEDDSYLYVDTNPNDIEDNGVRYLEAFDAVENINKALGLPSSLIIEMGNTTGSDGKQTRTYEDLGIEVSWKYHPNLGLEVTYLKLKK